MKRFIAIFALLFVSSASGYIDHFIDPIKTMKLKRKVNFTKLKPKVFKCVKVFDLEKFSIEGVIGSREGKKLVLKDPNTEKIYLLSEGTPIDVNLVLEKIAGNVVYIKEYYYTEKGRIKVRMRSIKINSEE